MKRVLFLIGLLVASACSYGQITLQPGTTVSVTCPTGVVTLPPPPPPNPTPAPPPPAPVPSAAPCAQFLGNFLLYNYCLQGLEKPTPAPTGGGPGAAFDPWTHRDLTGTHGNVLKTEGPAGHTAVFQLREPVGKRVTITGLQLVSSFGACEDIEIRVQGLSARSNRTAQLTITSTGNDPVTLILHCAGGAGVQINPG